jgi:hypothetical protein
MARWRTDGRRDTGIDAERQKLRDPARVRAAARVAAAWSPTAARCRPPAARPIHI